MQVVQHRVVLEVASPLTSYDRLRVGPPPHHFYEYQNNPKKPKNCRLQLTGFEPLSDVSQISLRK